MNIFNADEADSADLNLGLKELQNKAVGHFAAYRRTHDQLWELLGRAYMWWREADKKPEYLESTYKQHDIRQKTTGNGPNFSPLIRLVWGMKDLSPTDRATIHQWNQTLQGIHEHYTGNPDNFSHNAAGKLAAYIQDNGGVAGFASNARAENDGRRIDADPVLEAEVKEDISRSAIATLKAYSGIGSASIHEPVRVGGDGLLLLVARREADGSISVLGSSNNPEQIKNASINAIQRDLNGLPPRFRALVETIATQAFPPHALPSSPERRAEWFRGKFAEETDFWDRCVDCRPKGPRHKTAKRLLVRADEGDLLLSSSMTMVAPVTRCVPNQPFFGEPSAYLGSSELSRIEGWIESGELSLLRIKSNEKLEAAENEDSAAYELSIFDAASGSSKVLHFYEHTPDADITHHQADFDREQFSADWATTLPVGWFAKVREVWTDKWFAGLGQFNQITRQHNAILTMQVESDAISITFNQQGGVTPPKEAFSLPETIAAKNCESSFFSKDLAPILANLADVPAVGDIFAAGNAHAMVFRYETPSGQFEIAIPTLRADHRERDGKIFGPVDFFFPVEALD